MWVSIICKLPLFLGTMVMKSIYWVSLNMVGLNLVQAALRMLMVLKVIYFKIVDSELNKNFSSSYDSVLIIL